MIAKCAAFFFLVATKRLYMRVCPSVGPSDGRSVGRSVTSYFFGLLRATNAVYTALFKRITLRLCVCCVFEYVASLRMLRTLRITLFFTNCVASIIT